MKILPSVCNYFRILAKRSLLNTFHQNLQSMELKFGGHTILKQNIRCKLYAGREDEEEEERAEHKVEQGENVLIRLANRYSNRGRTAIADHFFTTLEGAKRLAKIGIAFVGTIRANKRCVSDEMRKSCSRLVLSSHFGFHENLSTTN